MEGDQIQILRLGPKDILLAPRGFFPSPINESVSLHGLLEVTTTYINQAVLELTKLLNGEIKTTCHHAWLRVPFY